MIQQPTRQYKSVDSIVNGHCSDCGGPLDVDYAHVGGYCEYQPFVVCPNSHCDGYYIERIPRKLAEAVEDFHRAMEQGFGVAEEMEFEEEAVI